MDINTFSIFVAILTAISASAERLVEIAQNLIGAIFPGIKDQNPDPKLESGRKFLILAISFGCCWATAKLSLKLLPTVTGITWDALPLGVLAMGGSSFWNSIQGYLNGLKNTIKPIGDIVAQASQKIAQGQQKEAEAAKLPEGEQKVKAFSEAQKLTQDGSEMLVTIGNRKP